jgi:hypothetical protein
MLRSRWWVAASRHAIRHYARKSPTKKVERKHQPAYFLLALPWRSVKFSDMARRRYRYDPSEHSAVVPDPSEHSAVMPDPVEKPADPTQLANARLQKSNRRLGQENAKLRREIMQLSERLQRSRRKRRITPATPP